MCREAALKADSHRLAAKLAASGTVGGVERLSRTDRRHAATAEVWDANPYALNTPSGIVDLRSGRVRPHAAATTTRDWRRPHPAASARAGARSSAMSPAATPICRRTCNAWRATASPARPSAHALFFLYGTGANGKSVFVNVLATILGDYATNAPMDTFMEARGDRHPTDLAGLRGARFVASIETEQGRRWNESKVKAITGGDKVSARFMRQDFFEYTPQFKLVIAGNHKPAIRNVDEAMKRRMHLIPFTVTIPPERRDDKLTEKLLAERDGILAWALAGCLQWQRTGLQPPASVVSATEEYFEAEDALGRWIDERCVRAEPTPNALTAELFNDWKAWAEAAGEFVGSQRRFSDLPQRPRHREMAQRHG